MDANASIKKNLEFGSEEPISEDDLINIPLGKTAQIYEWYVTRVPGGWIYTLKNSAAALGHAVSDYHSVFVPMV
jgi:hypothetical protein